MKKSVRPALAVATGLVLLGCGGGRAVPGVDAAAGGMGGAPPVRDAGMDVPRDSGPSCNPDAGPVSLDGSVAGWQFFGVPLGVSPSGSYLPALALLADGRPVVAWTDSQPDSVIRQFASFSQTARTYTSVWQCGAWQAMGAPVAGTLPALLVPPGSNQPVRAWVSNDNPSVLTVERWNGTAFEALGAPFQTQNQSIVSPVMVADASGNPILGWLDGLNSSTAQVAQWTGTAWQMLSPAGGIPGDPAVTLVGAARGLTLTLTADDRPIVAWPSGQSRADVAEFVSGTTWMTLGRAPNMNVLSASVNGPVVRVNSTGDIFLAWIDLQPVPGNNTDQVSVSRFDGTAWQTVGGPLLSGYQARDYDMIIDGSGAPIVGDSELLSENGGDKLFTYRWNGTAWQPPAPGVAAAGPELQTYVYTPVLALDGSGRLVAAWAHYDSTSGATAIAVARYQP